MSSNEKKTYVSKEKAERMISEANDNVQDALATLQNSDTTKEFIEYATKVVASLLAVNAIMMEEREISPDQNKVQDALLTVLEWLAATPTE